MHENAQSVSAEGGFLSSFSLVGSGDSMITAVAVHKLVAHQIWGNYIQVAEQKHCITF